MQLRYKGKLYPVLWIGDAPGEVKNNLKITSVNKTFGGTVILSDGSKFRNPGRGSWKRSEKPDKWVAPNILCMGIYPWLKTSPPNCSDNGTNNGTNETTTLPTSSFLETKEAGTPPVASFWDTILKPSAWISAFLGM
jgi:hypothetical protein